MKNSKIFIIIFYTSLFFSNVVSASEITQLDDIKYGSDPLQAMDVYTNKSFNNKPVIFMVHGGAWSIGDKKSRVLAKNKILRWVPNGFVFISSNYRMLPDAGPVEQSRDVARALAFAQSNAPTWGGDPSRFILMGHSAGAHLISLLAAAPSSYFKEFGVKPFLGAVALDSAAYDVVEIMKYKHARFYDKAFGSSHDDWEKASPSHHLSSKTVPMFVVCSTRRKNSCQQANTFVNKINSFGVRAIVLEKDLSHREINKHLGMENDYTNKVESFMFSLIDY